MLIAINNVIVDYKVVSSPYRAVATGITHCGSSVGQIVFAPLATYFIMHYDWKAFIWFVASLYLMCVTFGAFLRPLVLKEELENGTKRKLKTQLSKPAPSCFGTGNEDQQLINPFSRKDLFYQGSSSTLMKANTTTNDTVSTWDDFRHLLFTTARYEYLNDLPYFLN